MLVLARTANPEATTPAQETGPRAVTTTSALPQVVKGTAEPVPTVTAPKLAERYQIPVDLAYEILASERFNEPQVSRFLKQLDNNVSLFREGRLRALFEVDPKNDCVLSPRTPFTRHDCSNQSPLSVFVNSIAFAGRVGLQQGDLCQQVLSPSLQIAIQAVAATGLTPVILKKEDTTFDYGTPYDGGSCFVLSAVDPLGDFGNKTLGVQSGKNRLSCYSRLRPWQKIERIPMQSSATAKLDLY